MATYQIEINDEAMNEQIQNILNGQTNNSLRIRYSGADGEISAAVDVRPVVHCSECVHHDDGSPYHYCRKWRKNCPDDSDFFCKYGKRKDGGNDDG